MVPVFIWNSAGPCAGLSVYIDRISAMSSTCCATCGNSSETSIPHCPYFLNVHGDGISPPGVPMRSPHLADAGHRLALALQQLGLGIEGVHLADAAVAEDRDHRLCLWPGSAAALGGQRASSTSWLRRPCRASRSANATPAMPPPRRVQQVLAGEQQSLAHWRYTNSLRLNSSLAELDQAVAGRLANASTTSLVFRRSNGGRAKRQRKRAVDLGSTASPGFLAQPLGELLRLHEDERVVHQDQRLRRDGRAIAAIARS